MSNIQKRKQSISPIEQFGLKVGDDLIDDDGRLFYIKKITKKEVSLYYKNSDSYWGSIKVDELHKKMNREYFKLDKSFDDVKAETFKELASGLSSFDSVESQSTETALALSGSKEQAVNAKRALAETTKKLAIMQAIVEGEKNKLRSLQSHYKEKLEAITRVVDIMELYLGVREEIVQISEGEPAPIDSVLHFRQLVLHMDEEVAITEKNGLDFTQVDVFDDYMRENLDKILPEQKGVVVARPRRHDKDYRLGDDLFAALANSEMNENNRLTYILIRNGDNLYRIFSDKITIYPHLFPSQEEMKELQNPSPKWPFDKEKNEKTLLAYKRNVLMLQGLMDRTKVFQPMKPGINLLNPDTYGDSIKFIYDADGLTDGRPAFKDWLISLNQKLKRGDRVYFVGYPYGMFGREKHCPERSLRFPIPNWDHHPKEGIYNIIREEEVGRRRWSDDKTEGLKTLVCHHNPKDKVYHFRRSYWERREKGYENERKMSIPFRLVPDEDDFFINYELVKIEDIDYYLNDRVNRQHYAKMMPVLRGIKKMLLEEKEWENNFKRFVKSRVKNATDEAVEASVHWWKNKVIEKRPLRKEDSKALRMIEQELKRRV